MEHIRYSREYLSVVPFICYIRWEVIGSRTVNNRHLRISLIQEKVGKLTVRLKKTGAAGLKTGKDSYKAIGVIPLQLHK